MSNYEVSVPHLGDPDKIEEECFFPRCYKDGAFRFVQSNKSAIGRFLQDAGLDPDVGFARLDAGECITYTNHHNVPITIRKVS